MDEKYENLAQRINEETAESLKQGDVKGALKAVNKITEETGAIVSAHYLQKGVTQAAGLLKNTRTGKRIADGVDSAVKRIKRLGRSEDTGGNEGGGEAETTEAPDDDEPSGGDGDENTVESGEPEEDAADAADDAAADTAEGAENAVTGGTDAVTDATADLTTSVGNDVMAAPLAESGEFTQRLASMIGKSVKRLGRKVYNNAKGETGSSEAAAEPAAEPATTTATEDTGGLVTTGRTTREVGRGVKKARKIRENFEDEDMEDVPENVLDESAINNPVTVENPETDTAETAFTRPEADYDPGNMDEAEELTTFTNPDEGEGGAETVTDAATGWQRLPDDEPGDDQVEGNGNDDEGTDDIEDDQGGGNGNDDEIGNQEENEVANPEDDNPDADEVADPEAGADAGADAGEVAGEEAGEVAGEAAGEGASEALGTAAAANAWDPVAAIGLGLAAAVVGMIPGLIEGKKHHVRETVKSLPKGVF